MTPSKRIAPDIQSEIDEFLADGYRLDMIMPADDPRIARLSRGAEVLELVTTDNPQPKGRAGMEYRDLIPDRLGGRVIASRIRITEGGDVKDYVHYHNIRFQMIYCRSGWVRVVYEDQGPPFVLKPGDCVLQPPGIRHRVLESSAGAEVIEVSSPAVHETWVEHDIQLPTEIENPERVFNGQRFLRFVASEANLISDPCGSGYIDTGIADATGGLGSVLVRKVPAGCSIQRNMGEDAKRQSFIFVLAGTITLQSIAADPLTLVSNEGHVVTGQCDITAKNDAEILEVLLPPE
jgi:quercetin dioxygenase-like cupin family protein